MGDSPVKKKAKLNQTPETSKRPNEVVVSFKRIKKEDNAENKEKILLDQKKKNFVTACERVSYNAYIDYRTRFQLINIPQCLLENKCKHHIPKNVAAKMPNYAEQSFKIDLSTNTWFEALEVCQISILSKQYLSAYVLKEVVEIMLNAHDDAYANINTTDLIEKCQQILTLHFNTHPPCFAKPLQECYKEFLMSPMDPKEKTFTNRKDFEYDKGIVKYCMNRLEYELSINSKDEPLVDKCENIPSNLKQSVKGLHWEREKFEIFELHPRPERIKRLMSVLTSIIELLKIDLAMWHCRYNNNQGTQMMRSRKPLMASIFWSKDVLFTGSVTNNCRQILRLFIQFVHLGYPQSDVDVMTSWINTIVQNCYICETKSNSDYPNIDMYCKAFAREFHKELQELPNDSVIKVLQAIQPTFIKYLIGTLHLKSFHKTKEDEIIRIIIEFVKKSKWEEYYESQEELHIKANNVAIFKNVNNVQRFLAKKCRLWRKQQSKNISVGEIVYGKQSEPKKMIEIEIEREKIDQNHVIQVLYITLYAYMDAFSVEEFKEMVVKLNQDPEADSEANKFKQKYPPSENFLRKYKLIIQSLKELMLVIQDMKNQDLVPTPMRIFENIDL